MVSISFLAVLFAILSTVNVGAFTLRSHFILLRHGQSFANIANIISSNVERNTGDTPALLRPQLHAIPPALPCAIASTIGGCVGVPVVMSATKKGGWYRRINLPSFTPPDRVFAPVWTTLYASMGYSAFRFASRGGAQFGLGVALAHYFVNLSWSFVFFGMRRLRLAHGLNFVMLSTLAYVVKTFYAVDRASAILLLPYAAWLTFATFLNAAICKLNPQDQYGYNEAKFQHGLLKLQTEAAVSVGGL